MTKNPLLNALSALLYIVAISSLMFFGTHNAQAEDSVFAPIILLSLLSLSAAAMGCIFLYQPVLLFLDGKKKVAADLFLKTVLYFAGITITIAFLFFSGIFQ